MIPPVAGSERSHDPVGRGPRHERSLGPDAQQSCRIFAVTLRLGRHVGIVPNVTTSAPAMTGTTCGCYGSGDVCRHPRSPGTTASAGPVSTPGGVDRPTGKAIARYLAALASADSAPIDTPPRPGCTSSPGCSSRRSATTCAGRTPARSIRGFGGPDRHGRRLAPGRPDGERRDRPAQGLLRHRQPRSRTRRGSSASWTSAVASAATRRRRRRGAPSARSVSGCYGPSRRARRTC